MIITYQLILINMFNNLSIFNKIQLNKIKNNRKTKKVKKDQLFLILSLLIVLLAVFLRFYRFNQRWQIHYDQARDALVASQAIKLKKIPLNGPFTSAGPFVFGPLFYHLNIFSYLLMPNILIAPQIILAIINSAYALIMLKIGQVAHSKRMGLILGLLAATSPLHIERSSNLTQHNLIAVFSSLVLLSFVLYLKKGGLKYLFLLGFTLSCALSLHYQALNLFLYLPLVLITSNKNNSFKNIFTKDALKKALIIFFGFILPLLPLVIWDFQRGWKNINNILDYFILGQYRIWVSNRWLTYIGKFWPQFWSETIGSEIALGYVFIGLTTLFMIYLVWKRKISKIMLFTGLVFVGQIILNRYYRGEKKTMYLLYFQPLVILFSGFVIENLLKIKKELGILFFAIIMFTTLKVDLAIIKNQGNVVKPMTQLIKQLKTHYPNNKFRLFVYNNEEPAVGTMASLYLSFSGDINENSGLPLGFSIYQFEYKKIAQFNVYDKPVYIYDLGIKDNQELAKEQWFNVSPSYVYNDIVEWWKVKEFKSTFCLSCTLKEKLKIN